MEQSIKGRVLDLTDESGVHCTRLLAMMGYDVIRIEPPGGHPTRRIGPFYHGTPHPERSLHWFHYNLNKRSITLNIETRDGQALFKRLVATADIVVECFAPGYLSGLGLGFEDLRAVNRALVFTSITPFGQTGPNGSHKGCDIVAMATSGVMNQTGTADTPPLHASLPLAYILTGAQAASGTQLAYYHRLCTGEGQQVDVSQQECCVWAQMPSHTAIKATGVIATRAGDRPLIPGDAKARFFYPCKDGWVSAMPTYWSHRGHVIKWLMETGNGEGLEELAHDSLSGDKAAVLGNEEVMNKINPAFAKLAAGMNKRELAEEGWRRGMQVCPMNSMAEVLQDKHLNAKGHFSTVHHPELNADVTYSGPPVKIEGANCGYHRRAPLVGEHNAEIYLGELGLTKEDLSRYMQANVL